MRFDTSDLDHYGVCTLTLKKTYIHVLYIGGVYKEFSEKYSHDPLALLIGGFSLGFVSHIVW